MVERMTALSACRPERNHAVASSSIAQDFHLRVALDGFVDLGIPQGQPSIEMASRIEPIDASNRIDEGTLE